MSIEIIASIPLLPCPVEEIVEVPSPPPAAPPASTPPPPRREPAASRSRRRNAGRRALLPAPSVVLLAALAIACWVAALRNDRLRLEAARSQRPTRLAQQPPAPVAPHEGTIQ